jgi:hypothetical protein
VEQVAAGNRHQPYLVHCRCLELSPSVGMLDGDNNATNLAVLACLVARASRYLRLKLRRS